MTFRLAGVRVIFGSVSVAEWPPFGGQAAHSVDRVFSLYFGCL